MTRPLEIVRMPNGLYSICTGGGTYAVDAESGSCTCPSYQFRHAKDHSLCKHGRALQEHLTGERACPGCKGEGALRPPGIGIYATREGERDTAALPCLVCDGSGLRRAGETREERERRLKAVFA